MGVFKPLTGDKILNLTEYKMMSIHKVQRFRVQRFRVQRFRVK
jgi:hypothetical protein